MAAYTKDKLPPWPILGDKMRAADIAKRRADFCVGRIVFTYSTNRRYYIREPGDRSFSSGRMIERYCYGAETIESETRVSWVLSSGTKIPKKDPRGAYGLEDVDDALWLSTHRYRISSSVGGIGDPDLLRQIAALIGYEAKDIPE